MLVHMKTYYRPTPTAVVHLIAGTLTRCGIPVGIGAKFDASDLPSGERNFPICKRCRA